MPYKTNNELPDSVKGNLPTNAMDIWRNAFNSSMDKYPGDEERANKIAWGAIKNAGYIKGDSGKWTKANSELNDVEVFSTGLHKGVEFTEADLDEMVHNFYELKDRVKPILKVAHRNEMHKTPDGQPSLGWAYKLKRMGNKLLASFSDVPNLIKEAISKKLYNRVSSEIYSDLNIGGKSYKRVLSGVGILGSDIPVVKNLKDIEVFFADDNQAITTYAMDVSNGVIISQTEDVDMNEDLKKSFEERLKLIEESHAAELKKFTEEQDAKLQKFTEDNDKLLAEKNKEIEDLKAANLKREQENKITEFKTFCEAQVTAGKMLPAARDILIADLDKMEFSEGEDFSIPFDKFKSFQEKTGEILDKSERGIYLPPGERNKNKGKSTKYAERPGAVLEDMDIDKAAITYARENKVEYSEALAIILDENPAMAEAFSEAGMISREED